MHYCPSCGKPQQGHEKYCKHCGASIKQQEATTAKDHYIEKNDKSTKGEPSFLVQFFLSGVLAVIFTIAISVVGFAIFPSASDDGKEFLRVADLVTVSFMIFTFLAYRYTKDLGKYVTTAKLLLIPLIGGTLITLLLHAAGTSDQGGITTPEPIAQTSNCDQQQTLELAKNNTFLIKRSDGGHGTGFAIKDDGYILTNYHVIEGTRTVKVEINGEDKTATIWAPYPDDDLAVLKVDSNFKHIPWSDPASLKIAETLYAIGWPYDGSGDSSVTQGIYSRLLKFNGGVELIQTDAAINPGNSGGPLLNSCGVVGVNSLKETWTSDGKLPIALEGLGYALSTNYIKSVIYKK